MRLFLAIPLPDEPRAALAAAVARAAGSEVGHWGDPIANWVRPENLHVTLRFLGDVPEPAARDLVADLRRVPRPGPINLRMDGALFFPPRGYVRVIAAAVAGDVDRLAAVHRDVAQVCDVHGAQPDGRPFRPHVTLGRVRRGVDVDRRTVATLPGIEAIPAVEFAADAFTLYASQLRPGGPVYSMVERFLLAASDS